MIEISLKLKNGVVSSFYSFSVRPQRFSIFSSFWLIGASSDGPKYICAFDVEDDDYAYAFNESLTVCDMFEEYLGYMALDYSEAHAMDLIKIKYPNHFKYFDKLGYQSPAEGGGT